MRSDSLGLIRKNGVTVYVNSDIKFEIVNSYVNNVVIIYLFKFDIYLITVYSPPSYSDFENNQLLNFICDFCQDKEVVIQGDFNLQSLH